MWILEFWKFFCWNIEWNGTEWKMGWEKTHGIEWNDSELLSNGIQIFKILDHYFSELWKIYISCYISKKYFFVLNLLFNKVFVPYLFSLSKKRHFLKFQTYMIVKLLQQSYNEEHDTKISNKQIAWHKLILWSDLNLNYFLLEKLTLKQNSIKTLFHTWFIPHSLIKIFWKCLS
jgi:hypothetical protein